MSQMISDVQNYLATGGYGSYVALALYGSVVFFALIGLLKGLSRGILRQTVRSLTVALSALCSYIACQKALPVFSENFLVGKTGAEVLAEFQITDEMLAKVPAAVLQILKGLEGSTLEFVLAAPLGLIVLPLAFVLCFIVISALMLILHGLICAVLGFKKERNNGTTRFLGMLLGLAQGAAVGALLFLPVLGITSFVSEPVKTLGEDNVVRTYYEQYAEPLQTSKMADLIMNNLGGKQLLAGIGTVKCVEKDEAGNLVEKEVATQEIGNAILDLMDDAAALQGIDIKNIDADKQAAVNALIAKLGDKDDKGMQALSTIVISVLQESVKTLQDNPSIIPLDDEQLRDLVVGLCGAFSNMSADTLTEDLTTITKVLFVLSDNKVLDGNPTDALRLSAVDVKGNPILDGEGKQVKVISLVISTLESNARTKSFIGELKKYGVSLIAPGIDVDFEALESDLSNVASVEKPAGVVDGDGNIDKESADYQTYKSEVSNKLDTLLANNNLDENIDPAVQEQMGELVADYLLTNDVDPASISTEQMMEIFMTYTDANSNE